MSTLFTACIMPPKAAWALFISLPFSSVRASSWGTKIRQSTPDRMVTTDRKVRPPRRATAPSPIMRNTARALEAMITSTPPAHLQEAKHPPLVFFVPQQPDGLKQHRPVSDLAQNGQDAKGDKEAPVPGEGGQIEAYQADTHQGAADHVLFADKVADIDAGDKADGLDDAVGAEGAADLGVRQPHKLLHGNIEHILHGGELKGDPAGESEDTEHQPPVGGGLHNRLLCFTTHAKNSFHLCRVTDRELPEAIQQDIRRGGAELVLV